MRAVRWVGLLRRQAFAAILIVAAIAPAGAWAQAMPGSVALEALIKSTLMTFNDANVTGNYSVFHARLSKPFRDQFTADRLKAAFQSFTDQNIDIDIVTTLKPVLSEEPRIDDRGALLVRGHFDTEPNRVTFSLDFVRSEGQWKLINIHVKVKPPGQ